MPQLRFILVTKKCSLNRHKITVTDASISDKLRAWCGMRYDGKLIYSGINIGNVTVDAAAADTYHVYSKMAVI